MASHGQHHSVHTTPGMPLAGMAMQQQQQQPMPMHYTQQAQQPQMGEKMSMGGGGYGMPAPQLQAQMQMQLQSQMHMQQVQKQRLFWQQQIQEVEQVNEFKNHQLPLARIKKIMKSDEDVKMIAAEAPVVFSKACEMFVLDLTLRSWGHTEENKRRTLQRNDIAGAVLQGDIFDFLVDIVPRDEPKEEEAGAQWGGVGENDVGVAGDPSMPYGSMYYPPMGEQVMAPQHMGQQPMGQIPMNPYMGPAAQT